MSVSKLSASTQNYLKAIWALQEWSEEPTTPTLVAERVGVRLSSASDAVRKLAEQGFVEHAPYGAVVLTEAGRRHAVAMVRRHRLIETLLVDTLGCRWDQVHDEAETLEHAVSDFLVDRIDEFLGFPERDPHGDPIPAADGSVRRPPATPLTEAGPGRHRVERIADDDPELLQFFAERGIVVDAELDVAEGAPYSESLEVRVAGADASVPLGRAATDSVWVATLR